MSTFFQVIFLIVIAISGIFLFAVEADDKAPSTVDLVAPEIETVNVPDKVYAGSELRIEIQASDDLGMKSVAVFFRQKGSHQYTKMEMTHDPGTNRYYLVIKNVPGAGVEYYVEAMDLAGNLVRRGQDISPHSIVALPDFDSAIIKKMQDGRLNKQEILTLFSNNTVEGHHVRKNFTFTRYFAPDGRMADISTKKGKRAGRWRVSKDLLCENFKNQQENCREIVKEGDTITKYTTNRKGNKVVAIVYKRFRYGNPEAL